MAKIKVRVGEFLQGESDIATIPDEYMRVNNIKPKVKRMQNKTTNN